MAPNIVNSTRVPCSTLLALGSSSFSSYLNLSAWINVAISDVDFKKREMGVELS